MFPNSDSRFSRIWFSSSSLPSQDIESPTGNLHFPQMKTTGPSSASPFSTASNNFSSTVVESILETENVVFILFWRLLDAFFLVAILARLSKTSLSNLRGKNPVVHGQDSANFLLPLSSYQFTDVVSLFILVNFDLKKYHMKKIRV